MSAAIAQARWLPARRLRAVATASGAGGPSSAPLVAILSTAPRGRIAAAGVALALARAARRSHVLAGAVGEGPAGSIGAMPGAGRAARGLRDRGLPAAASGRLVWLADRRGALSTDDLAGRAAALSAELGQSAALVGAPAAIAIPFARTAALDRVLAWHDAIVVVSEPDAPAAVLERALRSLAALGRPVASMAPPRRLPGTLAAWGAAVPAEVVQAVADLELGIARPGSRDA